MDSVLMLTTLGSSCLEICENWLERICGEGTVNGVASEDDLFILPLHSGGDHRANQNADGQSDQDRKGVSGTIRLQTQPKKRLRADS